MLAIPRAARPGLEFLPPRTPWLFAFARPGSWLYLKAFMGIRSMRVKNLETLVRLYEGFQNGRLRLILAFRHPAVEDGPVLFRLMSATVADGARRLGVRLRRPPRGYFLYGRDVPVWAGQYLAWAFPRMGGISMFPGSFDGPSIACVRRLLVEGEYPVALAPEGQVTYHNEKVGPLEPGTAQLGFWCVEDLRRRERNEEVVILPICTSYHYREADGAALDALLARTEERCGLEPGEGRTQGSRYARIQRILGRLVESAEAFYHDFHGACLPAPGPADTGDRPLQERIEAVCDAALSVAERHFGLKRRGDFLQRVLSVRSTGLSWIYRRDIKDPRVLSKLEGELAGRVAAEAWLALRNMELVDVLEYIRSDYLEEGSSTDRFVETALNLWDVLMRLEGGNVSGRVSLRKTVEVVVNEPILVSARADAYRANRKKAVAALTDEIAASFRRTAEGR